MGRRKELKSVCHDLLESFVSRNNDLDGYWALGRFQAFLQSARKKQIEFDLTCEGHGETAFPLTLTCYRQAFQRHLRVRTLPRAWVAQAVLAVAQDGPCALLCTFRIVDDRGKTLACRRKVTARTHDPRHEQRRGVG